jgi:hypothetical protein
MPSSEKRALAYRVISTEPRGHWATYSDLPGTPRRIHERLEAGPGSLARNTACAMVHMG